MKTIDIVSYVTILVAFLFTVTIVFWLVYPYNPNDIKQFVVLSKKVNSGDTLVYEIGYCKNVSIPATVTRSFVNGVIFTTNPVVTDVPIGCHTNKIYVSVPQELTSGHYALRVTWDYKVNPIRNITITKTSNRFEILGSDYDRQVTQEL